MTEFEAVQGIGSDSLFNILAPLRDSLEEVVPE